MAQVNPLFDPFSFHSALLEMFPDPIWVHTTDGSVIYSNKSWSAYAGPGVESTNWLEHVHPEDRSAVERSWATLADTGAELSTTCRLRRGDGEHRWFRVQGRRLALPKWDPNNYLLGDAELRDLDVVRFQKLQDVGEGARPLPKITRREPRFDGDEIPDTAR